MDEWFCYFLVYLAWILVPAIIGTVLWWKALQNIGSACGAYAKYRADENERIKSRKEAREDEKEQRERERHESKYRRPPF